MSRNKPATVLVVDDDEVSRNVFREMLELEGYRVEVAEDADAALAACRRLDNAVDLAILDVVLPGTTGPELALQLALGGVHCSILYVSGYPPDYIPTYDPFTPYLSKPVGRRELVDRVAELLAER